MRLLVAARAPLSPDEAYYWVWSRALAPGYFDHPPMVALFIRLGTWLAGDGALGIRLLAPLAAALGTWWLLRAAEDLVPGRGAGLRAALLLNATLLMGAGAVTMTPDTPLLLFWTATLAAIGRVIVTGRPVWWLAAGLMAGLALDSKYTGVFLAPALLAWLVVTPSARPWLARPWPYLAGLVAVLAFAPVVLWNADRHWIGFFKQGSRLGSTIDARAVTHLAELVFGQIGLATPGLAVLFSAGLVSCWRLGSAGRLLVCVTVIPAAVFVQHALGDRVQANWPAILFPGAAIAAAALTGWRRWQMPSVALGAAITALMYLQAMLAPLPLPPGLDPTLSRLGGWGDLARKVAESAAAEHAAYVAIDNYGLASMMAWQDPDVVVVGVEPRWASFALPEASSILEGGAGLLLRPARRTDTPDPNDWASVAPVARVTRVRGALTAETYVLYRVTARPGGTAAALLPHPAGARHAPSHP